MSMAAAMAAPVMAEETSSEEATEEAASAAEKDIEPCEIIFWHAMNGAQGETLTALTDKFNEENEYGITVTLVNQGSYSDLSTALMSNAIGDESERTLPDISQAYNNWVTSYTSAVVPLDDFIGADDFDYEDIIESYRDECEVYGFTACLPFNKSSYVFFYNKTLFDELGIEAPTTWEEMETVGKTLYDEKGLALFGVDDMAGFVEASLHQNECDYITEEGAQFDNEAGLETLTYIMNLYNNGYAKLAESGVYFSETLSNGLIGGYIGSCTGVSYITTDTDGDGTDDWELATAPLPAGKTQAANQAGTNIYMFSTDENKQQAAWEYMKYLISTENTTTWAMETGYLPVRTSAYESDEYQTFMDEQTSGVAKACYAQAEYSFAQPVFDGSYEIMNIANTVLEDAILDELEPEEALENLVTEVNDSLEANGEEASSEAAE